MNRSIGDAFGASSMTSFPALSTPALLVDLDVFDANVAAMATLLSGSGKTVRPHVKTHRTPELARRQLGGDAVGVTCATVGEAEVMVASGIRDVLVANEVVDPAKIARLVNLATTARVAVAADAAEPIAALAAAADRAGVTLDVLIDVDIGLHRCGVESLEDAILLARAIEGSRVLRLGGIMGYEGRVKPAVDGRAARIATAFQALTEVRDGLQAAGFEVNVVSAAGTSTLREAISDPTITEIQAGVYALMEPDLLPLDLPFRCAAVLRGTVISRHRGRVVLDIGRRAVGLELGPPLPAGFEAIVVVNDEHAILTMTAESVPPLGSHLDLIPGQIRTTFNLHDHVWVSRRGTIIDCWPVSARGRSQ